MPVSMELMKIVSRTGLPWLLSLGLLAGAGLACSGKPSAEPAAAPHSATVPTPSRGKAAQEDALPAAEGFVGVVLAREAVNVSAETEGRLASVDVRVGDTVSRGARIASLVTENLVQDREMAVASLRAAQAEERRAAAQLDRAREQAARRLALKDIFSKEDLAAAQTEESVAAATVDTARAQVAQQRARLSQIETQIARSVLRSPIDGRVAERYFDPGALVSGGTPVVRLIASESYLVRFAVPPEKARSLAVGQAVEMKLDAAGSGLAVSARISQIAPQIDSASQMVFVEAVPEVSPEIHARLQDGLGGRVRVVQG